MHHVAGNSVSHSFCFQLVWQTYFVPKEENANVFGTAKVASQGPNTFIVDDIFIPVQALNEVALKPVHARTTGKI